MEDEVAPPAEAEIPEDLTNFVASFVIPQATPDLVDMTVIAMAVDRGCEMVAERWIRNDLLDAPWMKSSFSYSIVLIVTDEQAKRVAQRCNTIIAAHPEWRLPQIVIEPAKEGRKS